MRIKVVAASLEKRQLDYEWVLSTTSEEVGDEFRTVKHKHKKKKHEES